MYEGDTGHKHIGWPRCSKLRLPSMSLMISYPRNSLILNKKRESRGKSLTRPDFSKSNYGTTNFHHWLCTVEQSESSPCATRFLTITYDRNLVLVCSPLIYELLRYVASSSDSIRSRILIQRFQLLSKLACLIPTLFLQTQRMHRSLSPTRLQLW